MKLQGKIGLVAIDEAHLITGWGLSYKKTYRRLGDIREHLSGVPILACTATATPECIDDILGSLRLDVHHTPRCVLVICMCI